MLAYLLALPAPLLAPFTIYVARRHTSRFVAFHALQSLWMGLGLIVVCTLSLAAIYLLQIIPVIGWVMAYQLRMLPFLAVISALVGCFVLAVKAYNGEYARLPILGDSAERNLGG
jgi:uncharacterized membrane protein